MKLNLCIDIDGTITEPFYWLDYANKYFKRNLTPRDIKKYEIHEVLNIPNKEYELFYEIYREEMHLKAAVRENAAETLKELDSSHNINYVTARDPGLTEITRKWLDLNNLPKGSLYVLGSHYKVNKARELKCHIFIEDRYENAIQLALGGFKVLLIDCPYNRHPLISGITRVYDWKDIKREIKMYHNNLIKESQKIA